jgi:hypothetical protein
MRTGYLISPLSQGRMGPDLYCAIKVWTQAEFDTQKEEDQAVEVTRAQEKTALGTDSLPRLLFKFTQEPQ